jgi:SH3 domain protein
MHNFRVKHALFGIFCLLTTIAHAETVYVIDELKIGLHEDRTIDSPIIKIVPSGTSLSVIERDNDLIHVQEAGGSKGWINSKYVVEEKPGKSRITELEKNNEALKQEIAQLKTTTTAAPANGTEAQKELEQQLNSERLKAGDLQAQLAALKANVADIDDSGKLLADIETLKQQNRQLISQLESSGIEVEADSESLSEGSFSISNIKQMIVTLLIVFAIGIAGGIFILDFHNRRRHGGFRV